MTQSKQKTAAIFTTFHPDREFRRRIQEVVENCFITIVVDNTPGGHVFSSQDLQGLTLLQDGVNKGLGAALNAGVSEALRQQCDAVILFDQDSSPSSALINKLFEGLSIAGSRAVVGPLLLDDKRMTNAQADISKNISSSLKEVSCIATSGMCFHLNEISANVRFTETFFLDFVDFDWCWRLRQHGWTIFRLTSAQMPHRLGIAQRKLFGLTYHVPSPYRHYFQFRDTLKLIFQAYVPFYSRVRLSVILLPKLLVYPFLLDRGERFIWMLKGIRDAFLKVESVGAAATKLQVISKNSLEKF